MKLAIYVHDFRLEIGHSNALIELIRNLPCDRLEKISEIEVVSQICTPLTELFPNLKAKLSWRKVPLYLSKPALINSIFYHLWTFIYNLFFQKGTPYRIGMGACAFGVNACSIQFLQSQWTPYGLELERTPLKKMYKKILFKYYELCEKFIYNKKEIKLFSVANFLSKELKINFPKAQIETIYSSVNLERFKLLEISKNEIVNSIASIHPEVNNLDLSKPVYLFVGAYERKGLQEALNFLSKFEQSQIIIVGKPSIGIGIHFPVNIKIVRIEFSRLLPEIYSLSDSFIFPTNYEPFGLVIFEAWAMGLQVITKFNQVGASELLQNMEEVYFCDEKNFTLPPIKILSPTDRKSIRKNRLEKIKNLDWKDASLKLNHFLWK